MVKAFSSATYLQTCPSNYQHSRDSVQSPGVDAFEQLELLAVGLSGWTAGTEYRSEQIQDLPGVEIETKCYP